MLLGFIKHSENVHAAAVLDNTIKQSQVGALTLLQSCIVKFNGFKKRFPAFFIRYLKPSTIGIKNKIGVTHSINRTSGLSVTQGVGYVGLAQCRKIA